MSNENAFASFTNIGAAFVDERSRHRKKLTYFTVMIDPSSTSIPVSVEVSAAEVLKGILEINGILSFQDEAIEFAYRTKSLMLQGGSVQTIHIPLEKLQEIEYRSGVVSTKIKLYPRSLDVMEAMPGANSDKMIFQVKREGRLDAEAFAAVLKNRLYVSGETAMESIPFQLPDTNMGMTENTGLVYLDDEFLVFDLQRGLSGVTKSETRTIKIEPAALAGVRFNRGTLKDALYFRPKKRELLDAMPGDHEVEVKLRIAKRHRRASERLASRILHRIKESTSLSSGAEEA